jgi:tetratricopeptide (TPR) repeat protein
MERSLAYTELKQFARAIEGFQAVLVLVPHHMPTIKKLAEIYMELNNPQSALELFEEAIDAPPEETELEPLDENEEIVGHYTMGAASAPSRIGFEELNMMCELYFEISEYDKAAETLLSTIQRLKSTTFAPGSDVDLEIERLDIPIEIRVKLGICRLYQDFADEAKVLKLSSTCFNHTQMNLGTSSTSAASTQFHPKTTQSFTLRSSIHILLSVSSHLLLMCWK